MDTKLLSSYDLAQADTPMDSLDDEARTELLCFLVVGQLFTFTRDGVWSRPDHLVESSQIWLSSNGATCDWLERARLVEASQMIAQRESVNTFPRNEADLRELFNLGTGWFLDYRSPVIQRLHAVCAAYLNGR